MGMMTLQIVVAFIPGEPLEIAAGYAFGAWQGTVLCLLGAAGGSIGVFLLVRTLGVRAVELFVRNDAAALAELVGLVERGELTVDVDRRVALPELAAVHAEADAGTLRGKVVVVPE